MPPAVQVAEPAPAQLARQSVVPAAELAPVEEPMQPVVAQAEPARPAEALRSAVPVADPGLLVSPADRGRQRPRQLPAMQRAAYRSSTAVENNLGSGRDYGEWPHAANRKSLRFYARSLQSWLCRGSRQRRARPLGLKVRDDLLAKEANGMEHLLVRCRPDGAQ